MNVTGIAEVVAFGLSAFIAVAGALGVTTTMSMFRSGIFLMASFIGVAGLFILLSADLLSLLQIMMYIGGMLVMILFMVLFMPDPGGAMMAAMPGMMSPVERFFSRGLAQADLEGGDPAALGPDAGADPSGGHGGDHPHDHHEDGHQTGGGHQGGMEDMGGMDMSDMSMVTPVRRLAAWLAAATGCVLAALLLLRPNWPVSGAVPDPRSAEQVGSLLMDKYMIGFEGAGFLILIGVFGAVFTARPDSHPSERGHGGRVADAEAPPSIEPEPLEPLAGPPPRDGGDGTAAGGDRHQHGRHPHEHHDATPAARP